MAEDSFEIILADSAGFCMGVRRAVRMALSAADRPGQPAPIRTCGPLIHNRQVLEALEKRGVRAMADDPSQRVGTAVIRAHGLSRDEQEGLRERSDEVLDATCPHVRRVQKIAERYAAEGFACIVVGDAGHAEVEGVLSRAGGLGFVVSGPEDVAGLPPLEKVVVVAQTTQNEDVFHRTVAAVRERFGECRAFSTICRSTARRQQEVRDLCERAEAMVVVGGFNSANTRRLAEISRSTGTPTFHVETERELDLDQVLRYRRVGLTAGASTPNWMIRKVIRHLRDEHGRRSSLGAYLVRTLLRGLVNSNFYAAGAAAALTYALGLTVPGAAAALMPCVALTFFFVLGQQLLNQYGRRESLYLTEPERADFFMANEGPLVFLAACASGLALFLALLLGWPAFGVVLLGSVGGLMYRFRLPRALSRWTGFRNLEHVPGSKEFSVGLAWATLASVVPSLAAGRLVMQWPGVLAAFVAGFLMAFERTLVLDLRDVAADRIAGRETLVGVLGARTARRLFFALAATAAAVLAVAGLLGWTTYYFATCLAALPCAVVAFLILARPRAPIGESGEVLVDGQFYAAGLAALVVRLLTLGSP